jgi:hypothetical protein
MDRLFALCQFTFHAAKASVHGSGGSKPHLLQLLGARVLGVPLITFSTYSLSLSQCRSTIEGSSVSTLDKVPFTLKPESKHPSFLHKFAPNAPSRVISIRKRSRDVFTVTCRNEILRFHSIYNTVDGRPRLSLESLWDPIMRCRSPDT